MPIRAGGISRPVNQSRDPARRGAALTQDYPSSQAGYYASLSERESGCAPIAPRLRLHSREVSSNAEKAT